MFYACAVRFDVIRNFEKFLVFEPKMNPRAGRQRQSDGGAVPAAAPHYSRQQSDVGESKLPIPRGRVRATRPRPKDLRQRCQLLLPSIQMPRAQRDDCPVRAPPLSTFQPVVSFISLRRLRSEHRRYYPLFTIHTYSKLQLQHSSIHPSIQEEVASRSELTHLVD